MFITGRPAVDWLREKENLNIDLGECEGIARVVDGQIVASVVFHWFNSVNIWMHVASDGTRRWCNREYIRETFNYAFNTAGCRRVSGMVDASNLAAQRFDEKLGFEKEAVLTGAARDGGDVIIYCMTRENCRWV